MGGNKKKASGPPAGAGFPLKKARTSEVQGKSLADQARRASSSSAGAASAASRRVGGHVKSLITFLGPADELESEPGEDDAADAAPASRGALRSSTGTLPSAGDKLRARGAPTASRATSPTASQSSGYESLVTEPQTSSRSKNAATAGGKVLMFADDDDDNEVASSLPPAKSRSDSGMAPSKVAPGRVRQVARSTPRDARPHVSSSDNDDDDQEDASDGTELHSAIIKMFQVQQEQQVLKRKEIAARTANKLKSLVEHAEAQVGGDVSEVCKGLKNLLEPARSCAEELAQLESERLLLRGSEEEAVADLNKEAEQLLVKVRAQIAELSRLDAEERELLGAQKQLDQVSQELLTALQALPAQCERHTSPALVPAADELGAVAAVTQGSQ
jgi:hypothetical protein